MTPGGFSRRACCALVGAVLLPPALALGQSEAIRTRVQVLTPFELGKGGRGIPVEARVFGFDAIQAGEPCLGVPPGTRLRGSLRKGAQGWGVYFEELLQAEGGPLPVSGTLEASEFAKALKEGLHVRPGEVSRARLERTLGLPVRPDCAPVATAQEPPFSLPELPVLTQRTRQGGNEDPVNLIFVGGREGILRAFEEALWVPVDAASFGSVGLEVLAILFGRPYAHAPVTTHYLFGRREDLAFERQGPNARIRHHIRVWKVDGAGDLWAGAASFDNGIVLKPWRGLATHRIDPALDEERETIVRELGATGRARLAGYHRMQEAVSEGQNQEHARYFTDGRAAVLEAVR
jgi:hypothetical protein